MEFLEKVNYDDKTRNIQSYREKTLGEELFKARAALKTQQPPQEAALLGQIETLKTQAQVSEDESRAMKSFVEVLRGKVDKLEGQLREHRQLTHDKIVNSHEYNELKDRYRRFIETYKEVRAQNFTLKNQLAGQEAELVLSESDADPDHLGAFDGLPPDLPSYQH